MKSRKWINNDHTVDVTADLNIGYQERTGQHLFEDSSSHFDLHDDHLQVEQEQPLHLYKESEIDNQIVTENQFEADDEIDEDEESTKKTNDEEAGTGPSKKSKRSNVKKSQSNTQTISSSNTSTSRNTMNTQKTKKL